MSLNYQNYLSEAPQIDFSTLPEALRKGHELTQKALANNAQVYHSNETIKRVVDSYLKKLNRYLASQAKQPKKASSEPCDDDSAKPGPKPSKPAPAAKRTPSKTAAKVTAPVTKKPASPKAPKSPNKAPRAKRQSQAASSKAVEQLPEEIRFIRRYAAMHGKVRSRLSIMRLLSSLQKAMLEKRIRKNSPYATEILQIQDQLIKAAERMGENAEISISQKNLERYLEIASSQRIRQSIALLKRFVSLHGREGVEDKAKRLVAAMEKMVKSGKVTAKDPYAQRLNEAYKSLRLYLMKKQKAPAIKESALNGIYGLLDSRVDRSSNSLNGVISSETFSQLDFDTIGLKGKFRTLIGDPAQGFTAMVFGQPKSGKSTLMLEFAHHLAVHHGEVLYVAFEEGYGYTLREKITRLGAIHPRLHLAEKLPSSLTPYAFVFIDSVSRAGMDLEAMVKLKNSQPQTSFIFIFHATKDGKFRGGNDLAHEVDVIIEVGQNQASASGRFNAGGRIEL